MRASILYPSPHTPTHAPKSNFYKNLDDSPVLMKRSMFSGPGPLEMKWEGSIFNFFANLKGDITALDITLRIAKSLNAVSVSLMQNNEFVFKYPHNEVETSLDHFYYHIDEPFMDEFSSIVCTVTDKHNQTGKSKDDPQSQIGSVKFEELFNQIIDSHPTDEMILERLTQYEER